MGVINEMMINIGVSFIDLFSYIILTLHLIFACNLPLDSSHLTNYLLLLFCDYNYRLALMNTNDLI